MQNAPGSLSAKLTSNASYRYAQRKLTEQGEG